MTDDTIQLLSLLADLRIAIGDDGKRMWPELVEYARELKRKADGADAAVAVERERCAQICDSFSGGLGGWAGDCASAIRKAVAKAA